MSKHGGQNSVLVREMKEYLDSLGCRWSIEPGKKHNKIKVCGRLVGVIPMNGRNDDSDAGRRATLNIKSRARQVAQEAGATA
jgi:hypothetical protein